MKKTYLVFVMLLTLCLGVYAQQQISKASLQNHLSLPIKTVKLSQEKLANSVSFQKNGNPLILSAGDTILYEDFSDSIPNTWTQSGDFDWTFTKSGPSLSGYGMKSTTKSNGWMMLDGYLSGVGTGDGKAIVTTQAIDCSSRNSVMLVFQEYFYQLNGAYTYVDVSTDNVNWTEYDANPNYSGNQATANPQIVKLNLTDIAANQSTVYIRFIWDNTQNPGALNVFWQIDDVMLVEANDNNLSLTDVFTSTDALGFDDYYSMIPLEEVPTFFYEGRIVNNGALDQTNVTFNGNVDFNSASVFSDLSSPLNMLSAEVDTFEASQTGFMPTDYGDYTVSLWADQDETETASDTVDNYKTFDFNVNDTVYARDNGTYKGSTGPSSYGDAEMEIGTIFTLATDADITSASMYSGSGCKTNSAFYFNVYSVDPNDFSVSNVLTSDIYTFTDNNHSKKWLTINIPAQTLTAGIYILTVYLIDGDPNTGTVFIGDCLPSFMANGIQGNHNSFIFQNSDIKYQYGNYLPMMRMNFGGLSNGIHDPKSNNATLTQNYPNPFNGETRIEYSLSKKASNVSLNIMDLTGKVIAIVNEGSKAAGKYNVNFDASTLSAGTYLYSVNVDGAKTTKKMIITE